MLDMDNLQEKLSEGVQAKQHQQAALPRGDSMRSVREGSESSWQDLAPDDY
jgi:hypothetical protein